MNPCSNGLVVSAIAALLLLPAQYYIPEFWKTEEILVESEPEPLPPPPRSFWPDFHLVTFPTLDLFFTASLMLIGFATYICEWIQRKLMERRIVKVYTQ